MTVVRAFTQTYENIAIDLKTVVKISQNDNEIEIRAKWDTGANHTCICPRIATALNLKPCGTTNIHTSTGSAITNNYRVNLTLPQENMKLENIEVWSMSVDKSGYDILIGMDIISQGDLCISNYNGQTVMSFRMPSITCTDYVIELQKMIDKQNE